MTVHAYEALEAELHGEQQRVAELEKRNATLCAHLVAAGVKNVTGIPESLPYGCPKCGHVWFAPATNSGGCQRCRVAELEKALRDVRRHEMLNHGRESAIIGIIDAALSASKDTTP